MKKIGLNMVLLICMTVITSCSQNEKKTKTLAASVDTFENKVNVYGIDADDVVIRKGPGTKYGKVVNEKATQSLGEIQYCELDFSTKVEILEEKDTWSKIKVVEPEWLSDTYIGWIPWSVIITKENQEKQSLGKLDVKDYELLKSNHNSVVQNFRVLLKRPKFDKNYVYQFIKEFRKKYCTMNCNVEVYDSKSIVNLLGVYPLAGKDYLKVADHLISISTFDAVEIRDWYPYQDFHYKELGGKNWNKEPLK